MTSDIDGANGGSCIYSEQSKFSINKSANDKVILRGKFERKSFELRIGALPDCPFSSRSARSRLALSRRRRPAEQGSEEVE